MKKCLTMEVNPYSMLEVTLTESSQEIIPNEDPLRTDAVVDRYEADAINRSSLLNQVIVNSQKLATLSVEEGSYRCHVYRSLDVILQKRLHCTICDVHIGCYSALNMENVTHPLLAVLTCPSCTLKYRFIDFPASPEGHDVRCRWCGGSATNTQPLRYCAKCPFAFCEKCIRRNLPLQVTGGSKNWVCCVCNLNLLWPSRAVLWALMTFILRSESTSFFGDVSQCCKSKKKRKINAALPIQQSIQPVHHLATNGLSIAQPMQRTLVPLDKLIIETAWIKQKLYLISSLLGKMNDMVTTAAAELSSYGRADLVRSKIETVASFTSVRAEQLAASCNVLTSDFNRKLDEARTLTDEFHPLNEEGKTVQQPTHIQNSLLERALAAPVSEKSDLLPKGSKNPIPECTQPPSTVNENVITKDSAFVKIEDVIQNRNCRRFNLSILKKKVNKINQNTKSNKNTQKLPRNSVNKKRVKNLKQTEKKKNSKTILPSPGNAVSEFEGVPIKKCYVKLFRIPLPSSCKEESEKV